MSDSSKNFSLRLSGDDQARLERLAQRLKVDRTGTLRLLIRRATIMFAAEGHFTIIARGHMERDLPIRLRCQRSAR